MAANTWPMIDHEIGQPFCSVMVCASSCERACRPPLTLAMMSARSAADMRGHGPSSNALRAAATARSTSASLACGTRAIGSSVRGEITSMVSVPWGSTKSPPMKSLSCTSMAEL